jgi:hypothetical protein
LPFSTVASGHTAFEVLDRYLVAAGGVQGRATAP